MAGALAFVPRFAADGATQRWNPGGAGGGNGTWHTGVTPDWDSGQTWTTGNDALFSGTGGIVTLVNPSANSLIFAASGPYLLESGTLTLTGSDKVTVDSAATISSAIVSNANMGETGPATLTLTGSASLDSNILTINLGTVNIAAGGAVSSWAGVVGDNAGDGGRMTVTGSGSAWENSRGLYIGSYGVGAMQITAGGAVSNGSAYIGYHHGSSGALMVTGSGSTFTNTYNLTVNRGSAGVAGGGAVSSRASVLGANADATGMMTVTGSGSAWTDVRGLYVGEYGHGIAQITDGGAVSNGSAFIGYHPGSSGILTVTGSGSTFTNSVNLSVGESGSGTLAVTNAGAVSDGFGYIGDQAGSSGAVTLSGIGSTWENRFDLYIGKSGTGTLLVAGGGVVTSGAAGGYIANDIGSSGMVMVTGVGSKWTGADGLTVGSGGAGTLTVTNAATVFDSNGVIAGKQGSSGNVTVSGAGSTWTNTGTLLVGGTGTGMLMITNGGSVSSAGPQSPDNFFAFSSSVGNSAGSNGMVTVSGTGSIWTNDGLVVGNSGTGTLLITDGGTVVTKGYLDYLGYWDYAFNIGENTTPGLVTVTGTGSKWIDTGGFTIGDGTLLISNGGTVSDAGGFMDENNPGPIAQVTVTGSGSRWINTSTIGNANIYIGNSGRAALLIADGGAVSGTEGYVDTGGTATVTGAGSKWINSSALDVNGGTLLISDGGLVTVNGPTTIESGGTLEFDGRSTLSTVSLGVDGGTLVTLGAATFAPSATLGSGGINTNSNGFNSAFSGNFDGTGGISKFGAGTLTLTGSSAYTGATNINAGTLALTTAASQTASLGNTVITTASGTTFAATLAASHFSKMVNAGTTGSGMAGATLTLDPGSTFSMAGSSIATFNLQQETSFSGPAFTIGGASGLAPSLIFDIGNAATGTDKIDVTKTVTVLATGAKITIDALAGDTTLTAGSYDLITSAGGFSGTAGNDFTLTDTTLVVDGATYDLSLANSSVDDEVLTVSAAPVPASAQGRSFASAGDQLGNTPAAAVPASAPLVATAAVPEPGATASLLSAVGLAAIWQLRRRRG